MGRMELLKAARLIKDECSKSKGCENCFFAVRQDGEFNFLYYCALSKGVDFIPQDWDLETLWEEKI